MSRARKRFGKRSTIAGTLVILFGALSYADSLRCTRSFGFWRLNFFVTPGEVSVVVLKPEFRDPPYFETFQEERIRWGDLPVWPDVLFNGRSELLMLEIPIWILTLPGVAVVWLVRDVARTKGACACGYDLTGNVSKICPECGCVCKRLFDLAR